MKEEELRCFSIRTGLHLSSCKMKKMLARALFRQLSMLAALCLIGCSGQSNTAREKRAPAQLDAVVPATPTASQTEGPGVGGELPVVLFLGDSLSAGYGLPEAAAFPALVEQKIIRAGLGFQVVNAGVSGDTSAGGLRRVDWLLRHSIAVLVLELGGNDGLRGVDLEDTQRNLQAIIDRFRGQNPDLRVVIAGMMIPPNLGSRYSQQFTSLYSELAGTNGATLIPFLLEGVGGVPELNLPDGIHPTADGHKIVADVVWKYLEPVLQSIPEES